MGNKQVLEEADQTQSSQQQWVSGFYFQSAWQWRTGIYFTLMKYFTRIIFPLQKNFKEISKSDEIDKKTLAKMRKNAARDADIIWWNIETFMDFQIWLTFI